MRARGRRSVDGRERTASLRQRVSQLGRRARLLTISGAWMSCRCRNDCGADTVAPARQTGEQETHFTRSKRIQRTGLRWDRDPAAPWRFPHRTSGNSPIRLRPIAQGQHNSSRFRLAAALRCLRHRLLLQSVNARESANAILLQRYRFARFRADAFLLGQLGLAGKQSFAGLVFSHEARLRPHQGKEKSAIDTGQ